MTLDSLRNSRAAASVAGIAVFGLMAATVTKIDWVHQVSSKPFLDSREYNFSVPTGSGVTGSLSVAGSNNVLTFAPCPTGISPNEVAISSITTYPSGTLTNATNATPIVVTETAHGRSTGDIVVISGVLGNLATNGRWVITVVDANSYSLGSSVGSGAYTSGGTVYKEPLVTTASTLPITASAFGTISYTTNSAINGVFPLYYVSPTSFTIGGATTTMASSGGYVSFDNYHYVYISGGTGTPESPLIQGGTCTSGASSGTIRVTTANTHTGTWSAATATGGIREAIQSCPGQSGCTIILPAGVIILNQKLVVGDGDLYTGFGYARSVAATFDKIVIEGQGRSTGNGVDDTGTVLNYQGPPSTGLNGAVEFRGQYGSGLKRLKINGSRLAGHAANTGLLLLNANNGRFEDLAVALNAGTNSRGIDLNLNDSENVFDNVDITTESSGSIALGLGTDGFYAQFGGGVSQNVFRRVGAFGGTGGGFPLYIAAADNNLFEDVITFPGGSGATVGLFFQRPSSGTGASFASFPTENTFIHCPILGGVSGFTGGFANNIFLPYPVSDTEAIPSISGVMGMTTQGQWFGTIPGTRTGADVASAGTITPTGQQFRITGSTTVTTINIPYTASGLYVSWEGCITMIPTGAVPFATGGNIAANLTATVNVPVVGCYVASTAQWYLK